MQFELLHEKASAPSKDRGDGTAFAMDLDENVQFQVARRTADDSMTKPQQNESDITESMSAEDTDTEHDASDDAS